MTACRYHTPGHHLRSNHLSRLERQLNLARNLAADDSSFATRAIEVIWEYEDLCSAQDRYIFLIAGTSGIRDQTAAARNKAAQFSQDIGSRLERRNFAELIARHSSKDPVIGKCNAILVIPCPGVAAAMLQRISSTEERDKFLKHFMLVQGPKLDTSTGEALHQLETPIGHREKTTSGRSLQVPSSRVSDSKKVNQDQLHNPFLHHPTSIKQRRRKSHYFPRIHPVTSLVGRTYYSRCYWPSIRRGTSLQFRLP
ncbi:hypothetical protein BDR07DRAFT_1522616 [Suillus spraguei]|nr:hypothetical protein BDR07DRAFT_1522616 [Suillus spraguei]